MKATNQTQMGDDLTSYIIPTCPRCAGQTARESNIPNFIEVRGKDEVFYCLNNDCQTTYFRISQWEAGN